MNCCWIDAACISSSSQSIIRFSHDEQRVRRATNVQLLAVALVWWWTPRVLQYRVQGTRYREETSVSTKSRRLEDRHPPCGSPGVPTVSGTDGADCELTPQAGSRLCGLWERSLSRVAKATLSPGPNKMKAHPGLIWESKFSLPAIGSV